MTSDESYPSRPLRLVVPFGAGPTEALARWVGDELARRLGQPVVVENHPGQGGVAGTRLVAQAAPDGYTLLAANPGPLTVGPSVKSGLGYAAKDFAPIILMVTVSGVVVARRGLAAEGIEQLVDHARGHPGSLRYGSAGAGTVSHLAMEWLNSQGSLGMTHVPCEGLEAAVPELEADRLDLLILPLPEARPLAKAGKIRALAVTRRARSALWPELPTVEESGIAPFESFNWNGLAAPAATPRDVVSRLAFEVNGILGTAKARGLLEGQGYEIAGGSPEVFGAFMNAELRKWIEVAKLAGLSVTRNP